MECEICDHLVERGDTQLKVKRALGITVSVAMCSIVVLLVRRQIHSFSRAQGYFLSMPVGFIARVHASAHWQSSQLTSIGSFRHVSSGRWCVFCWPSQILRRQLWPLNGAPKSLADQILRWTIGCWTVCFYTLQVVKSICSGTRLMYRLGAESLTYGANTKRVLVLLRAGAVWLWR